MLLLPAKEAYSQQRSSHLADVTATSNTLPSSNQASFRITSLMAKEPEPYQPGPLAALLSNQRPVTPTVEPPKTASEQFRENRKLGDYSRDIGDKEKSRLLKHIDASYKRLSLGSELGRKFLQDEESTEHARGPPGGDSMNQRTRRSLDWETENSVLTSSLLNRNDSVAKHSTPLDHQAHFHPDLRLSRDVSNLSTNQTYSPFATEQSLSSILNRVPDGQSSYDSPSGNQNLNNNLIPSPTSGFSKFVSGADAAHVSGNAQRSFADQPSFRDAFNTSSATQPNC